MFFHPKTLIKTKHKRQEEEKVETQNSYEFSQRFVKCPQQKELSRDLSVKLLT